MNKQTCIFWFCEVGFVVTTIVGVGLWMAANAFVWSELKQGLLK